MSATRTSPDTLALRDELEALALAGAGWPEVLGRLAAAAGREVRLAAADTALLCAAGSPVGVSSPSAGDALDAPRTPTVTAVDVATAFASSGPVDVHTVDGIPMRATAVSSGGRRLGVLLVSASPSGRAGALADPDALLRAAVTAVAIVALRRDVQAAAVAESAGWLVDELRFGSRRSADDLAAVALRFGVHLAEEQSPVVIGYDGEDRRTFATALSWLESPVRVEAGRAWTLIENQPRDRMRLIHRRLQSFLAGGRVRVASGPPARGGEAIRLSFDRAGFALRMLESGRVSPAQDPGLLTFHDLGLAGALYAVPRAELAALVQHRLGPVLSNDDLLATLRAWYDSGGSRLAVADAVHIHRNSVGHRMERLRTLLGCDPADPAVALQLRAALVAADVIAASD